MTVPSCLPCAWPCGSSVTERRRQVMPLDEPDRYRWVFWAVMPACVILLGASVAALALRVIF